MGLGPIKTEAGQQNGKGAWMRRDQSKVAARKQRRRNDRRAIREQE
jgi:hypothetical protein